MFTITTRKPATVIVTDTVALNPEERALLRDAMREARQALVVQLEQLGASDQLIQNFRDFEYLVNFREQAVYGSGVIDSDDYHNVIQAARALASSLGLDAHPMDADGFVISPAWYTSSEVVQ